MIKNVIILLGRGVEGCGVTKHTVEFSKWLESNSYNYTVISAKDKRWARKECHSIKNLEEYKFSNDADISKIIEKCNASDLVIINSLPSKTNGRGKGHDERCISNFIKLTKEVNTPFVLIQHDHTHLSINRNAALQESIDKSKVIFAHSETGDFVDVVNKTHSTGKGSSLMSFFDEAQKPFYTFQPGLDFETNRNKYWLPIEEQTPFTHKWIGRTTSWKGYNLMMDFHNHYLKPNQYVTTLEGIEKSPAFLDFREKHKNQYIDFITPLINPSSVELNQYKGDFALCFSIYNNDEMLKRAAKTAFSYQLSILHPKFIKKSIEYTHCELTTVGTIPVFRKEYGDACKHRVYDTPLTESKNNGTIWLSQNNMNECLDKINQLSRDNAMRNEYREMAYEFYKLHQDSSYVFNQMMEKIQQHV